MTSSFALIYQSDPAATTAAQELFPQHLALYRQFMAEDRLLSFGPWSDFSGSLAIFPTAADAEAFKAVDPFFNNGVVAHAELHEWNDMSKVVSGDATAEAGARA